jgi:hypothetical protein
MKIESRMSDGTWMGFNIIIESTLPKGTVLLVKDKDNWAKLENVTEVNSNE